MYTKKYHLMDITKVICERNVTQILIIILKVHTKIKHFLWHSEGGKTFIWKELCLFCRETCNVEKDKKYQIVEENLTHVQLPKDKLWWWYSKKDCYKTNIFPRSFKVSCFFWYLPCLRCYFKYAKSYRQKQDKVKVKKLWYFFYSCFIDIF